MLQSLEIPIDLRATNVYERNWSASKRFIVNQGGTRSSKTYSICQVLILRALRGDGFEIDIIRKHLPSLKGSAMKDFFEILSGLGEYDERSHNKTDGIYKLNGSTFNFYSLDEPQKIRGRKRDILWMNEANEFSYEDFQQLNLRTSHQVFLDYNPSDEYHWIYEKVVPRADCEFIQSTYLDNPFLPEELKIEIELLKTQDENYWKIYGLGERGSSQETVYTNWDVQPFPELYDIFYGLDFGYNNKTALVKIGIRENDLYCQTLIYSSGLTNSDLINLLKEKVLMSDEIYADSAEKQRIEEISREGFNIRSSDKSVKDGIDFVKRLKIHIDPESEGMIKEIKSYRWKIDKNGKIVSPEQPVKFNDHALDALRYAVYTKLFNEFSFNIACG